MKNLGCFLAVLVLFVTVPAHAKDLTIFGGVQAPGKLTLQSAQQAGSTLTNPANFGAFGIRYGSGRVFGGESTFAYSPNFVESQTKAVFVYQNLIVHMPLPKARPYGTVGLGTVFTIGDGIADVGNKFAVNYGGGVKVDFAGPVGGQFDMRGYLIPGFGRDGLTIRDETLHMLEVSIGLMFSWGRNR
ncbi:MAG: outer membrane beta-barrel protein [Acidobacteria bacterium]|nr:outer membrane beta-barrel protein [Acidobacteriota bacterium]